MSPDKNNISAQLKIATSKQDDLDNQRLRRNRRVHGQNVYKIKSQPPISRDLVRQCSSSKHNISAQLKIAGSKQNDLDNQRLRRRRRVHNQNVYKIKSQSFISRVRRRKCPSISALPTSFSSCGNYPSTPMCLPITKQDIPVCPIRGLRNSHAESVFEHENVSPFRSKSSTFYTSPKPPLHACFVLNMTNHCYKITEFGDNTFQNEIRTPCSPNQEASSRTHKLVSECIRNSYFPVNSNISPTPTTSCYTQFLSSHLTNIIPKDHSTLEERGTVGNVSENINLPSTYPPPTLLVVPIEMGKGSPSFTKPYGIPNQPLSIDGKCMSPCTIMINTGSMESFLESSSNSSSTAEPRSLSESSLYLSESMYDAPCNTSISVNSSEVSWDSEDENINQSLMCLNSEDLPFEGNFTCSKPVSEENSQIDNSSTIRFPVKGQSSPQLQNYALPSNTSTSPLCQNENTENTTGSIGQPSHTAILRHRPVKVKSSNDSEVTNILFAENVQMHTSLDSSDSLKWSCLCSVEPLPHQESDVLPTIKLSKSPKRLKGRHRTANIVENVRQSLDSLSVTSPSDASEKVPRFDDPSSVAPNINKTKKKSKIISWFTACLRPSSPRQETQK